MASVKEYESLVKKIKDTKPGDNRSALVEQKNALLATLRKQAGGKRDERRKLKFELDEANNS